MKDYPLFRMGNLLYRYVPSLYLPLYTMYKIFSDKHEREFVSRHLRRGAVVADVGANIGVYTRFLASIVGSSGVVHAFDPSTKNIECLKNNVKDLTNVRINNLAVADKTGALSLYLSGDMNIDHRTYPTEEPRKAVEVGSITLDDYFRPFGQKVDFIKIDVQGFEYFAFLGMREILAKNRNLIIIFELWPYGLKMAGTDPRALLTFMKEFEFSLNIIRKGEVATFTEEGLKELKDDKSYLNVLAIRDYPTVS